MIQLQDTKERIEESIKCSKIEKLNLEMIAYEGGNAARIQHFIKVHAFARLIGRLEGLDPETLFVLEAGALTHDIDRICYLIGHHHTYTHIRGQDYQILVEADFLVNLYENKNGKEGILSAYSNIFQTESGKRLCGDMFGIEAKEI